MDLSQKQKAAILIIIGGITCVIVASMLYNFFTSRHISDDDESASLEMPEAIIDEMEDSKTEAYRRNDVRNVDRYWDESESEDDIDDILSGSSGVSEHEAPTGGDGSQGQRSVSNKLSSQPAPLTVDDLVVGNKNGQSSSARASSPGRTSSSSEIASSPPSSARVETGQERLKRYEREREAAVQSVVNGTSSNKGHSDEAHSESKNNPEERMVMGKEATIRKSGIISSLDDGCSSGISSLDEINDTISQDENYPFQCMFVRQTKLKTGDRVAVRLLEDMVVNSILVQKNTHLMAYCTIDDRVKLNISSIEVGGKIYRLDYEAYDNDGALGIYCPDLSNMTNKQIKGTGGNLINRIIGNRVNSIAREVVNTGVAIANGNEGEKAVMVPAGYTFYIVKKKKN